MRKKEPNAQWRLDMAYGANNSIIIASITIISITNEVNINQFCIIIITSSIILIILISSLLHS